MKLTRLHLSNFCSFVEAEIKFPSGLVAVSGRNFDDPGANSNGSGKSSIFDGIAWALYGRTLRPIGPDDVIKNGAKKAVVGLAFTVGEQGYFVARARGSKSDLQLFRQKGEDLEDISGATIQLTQSKIDQLVGLDFETFNAVATFGPEALRFAGATDKEQKEILERLLGLQVYGAALENVRAAIGKADATVTVAQRDQAHLEEMVRRGEEQAQTYVRQKECAIARYDAEIVRLEGLRSDAVKEADHYLLKSQEDMAQIIEADAALNDCGLADQDLAAARAEESKHVVKSHEIKTKLDMAQHRLARTNEERRRVRERVGKPCGECGRPVTMHEIGAADNSLYEKFMADDAEVKALTAELTASMNSLQVAQQSRKDLEAAARDQNAARAEVVKMRNQLSTSVAQATANRTAALQRAESIKAQMGRVDNGRGWDVQIDAARAAVARDREKLDKTRAEISRLSDDLLYLRFWEKGFGYSGIRSMLLDGVAAQLTDTANRYLRHLGGTVRIEVSTQSTLKSGEKRERFDVKVFNRFGSQVYAGNSGGERQRIDLALALALHVLARQRCGAPVEFAIFDEVFERVDEVGCEVVMSLLRAEELGTIFVVAHNPSLAERFPSTIEVEKREGVSRVTRTPCGKSEPSSGTTTAAA